MKFLYGTITHTLPKGWTPPDVWPEFGILAQPVSIVDREEVGIHPRGVRWSLWPFTFEEYIGENEPNMQDSKTGNLARNRIIYWKRITNTPVPSRWRALGRPWRIDGFYTFTEEDYTKTWSTDAKRKLNHWRNMHAHKHRIEKISFEEYSTAYTHSTVAKKVGTDLLHILERKLTLPQCAPHIELWGVRNSAGTIIAGTGILYSPTAYASVREAPFVCKDQTHTGVVAALMEHWFAQSRERGMDRVVSTHFWQKGDPTGWKGFSLFKSRFGFSFVAYPPALWRFVPGKFF